MRKIILLSVVLGKIFSGYAQQGNLPSYNPFEHDLIPTTRVFNSVLLIVSPPKFGTCTVVIDQDQKYIITAKHILPQLRGDGQPISFQIIIGERSYSIAGKAYVPADTNVDVAVIRPDHPLPFHSEGINLNIVTQPSVGQSVLFLGYPLGFSTIIEDRAYPLVKKGIMSGGFMYKNHFIIALDGHNNPGFSGGPVLSKDSLGQLGLLSIVNGYFPDLVSAKATINQQEVDIPINTNSGIIYTTPIRQVLDIITRIR